MMTDDCSSCTRLLQPDDGAAFQHGEVLHLDCFLNDGRDREGAGDSRVPESQWLIERR